LRVVAKFVFFYPFFFVWIKMISVQFLAGKNKGD
jgi:hypothetical protein